MSAHELPWGLELLQDSVGACKVQLCCSCCWWAQPKAERWGRVNSSRVVLPRGGRLVLLLAVEDAWGWIELRQFSDVCHRHTSK